MREDVHKFLFLGPEEEKEEFFKRAQEEGVIHFIDPKGRKEVPPEIHHITSAIKILRGQPSVEQEENYGVLDPDKIVEKVLELHEKSEKLLEELRIIDVEKSRIEVFGNFSFDDVAFIEKKGHCVVQFFCSRPHLYDAEVEPENLIFIANEHGLDFYVAINDQPVAYEKMIEMKFDRALGTLKKREIAAKVELHQVEHELKGYAKYNEYLHFALIEKLNFYHLYNTQTYVQQALGDTIFAIEGWVPENKVSQLEKIVGDLSIYYEEIAIEPTDVIPTYLENQGLSRLGEDLVHIYDTPSATDKDPSLWVLYAFALFFAFIIQDAGYGLVFLAIALYLYYKFPNAKGAGKRALDLFTVLSIGCIIWGTLMTSFFGIEVPLDNPLRKVSLVQWLAEKKMAYLMAHQDQSVQDWIAKYPELAKVNDPHEFVSFKPAGDHHQGHIILNKLTDNVMFELALFIGVVHLILSFCRYVRRNWQNIGWVAFLIGAYLYFPYYLKVPSLLNYVGGIDLAKGGEFGLELMFVGIGVAWVLAIIRHGWTGVFEVMVLIQVFADTLSYLRLYALGLAGAIVASTINDIASGLPFMVAALLILVSHFVNIILAIMSGIIHGLRLNFLEWYHYSFEGGGKQFQPLKLLKKE